MTDENAHTVLLATVGNSPQQLALGIALLAPDEVVLIHSETSKKSIGLARKYLDRAGVDTRRFKRATKICVDANDPQDIVAKVRDSLTDQLATGWEGAEVHFLASGGTAAMTGAVTALLPSSAVIWFSQREQLLPLCVASSEQLPAIPVPLGQPISYEQITSINPQLDFNDRFEPSLSWLLADTGTDPMWFDDADLLRVLALTHAGASSTGEKTRALWDDKSIVTKLAEQIGFAQSRLTPEQSGVKKRRTALVGVLNEMVMVALVAHRIERFFTDPSNPVALDLSVEWKGPAGEPRAEIDIVLRRGPFLAFISVGSGKPNEMVKKVMEVKDRATAMGGKEAPSLTVIHEPHKLATKNGYVGFVQDVRGKVPGGDRTTVLGLADLLGWPPTDLDRASDAELRVLADATLASITGESSNESITTLDAWLKKALPNPGKDFSPEQDLKTEGR